MNRIINDFFEVIDTEIAKSLKEMGDELQGKLFGISKRGIHSFGEFYDEIVKDIEKLPEDDVIFRGPLLEFLKGFSDFKNDFDVLKGSTLVKFEEEEAEKIKEEQIQTIRAKEQLSLLLALQAKMQETQGTNCAETACRATESTDTKEGKCYSVRLDNRQIDFKIKKNTSQDSSNSTLLALLGFTTKEVTDSLKGATEKREYLLPEMRKAFLEKTFLQSEGVELRNRYVAERKKVDEQVEEIKKRYSGQISQESLLGSLEELIARFSTSFNTKMFACNSNNASITRPEQKLGEELVLLKEKQLSAIEQEMDQLCRQHYEKFVEEYSYDNLTFISNTGFVYKKKPVGMLDLIVVSVKDKKTPPCETGAREIYRPRISGILIWQLNKANDELELVHQFGDPQLAINIFYDNTSKQFSKLKEEVSIVQQILPAAAETPGCMIC